MRHIIKLPINATIQSQLLVKQQNIDNGILAPKWGRLNSNQKTEIKNKLLQAQKHLCCYCECKIDYDNHHIEHFYERHDRPDKIYDFGNLILSCQGQTEPQAEKNDRKDNIRCGHGKTKTRHQGVEIDYALLLNPMQNNETLFYYNDSGKVEHNTGNQADIDKVVYTCERLNLNSSRLKNQRINIIKLLNNELDQLNLTDRKAYIQALLNEQQPQLPAFYSTIKDNFGFILQE